MRSLRRKTAPEVRRQMEISTLLESMPEGVLIVDADANVVEANTAAERFLAKSRADLRGSNVQDLGRLISISDGARSLSFPAYAVARALRGETIRNERRSFRPLHDGGDPVESIVSASPINENGDIIGAVVVIRDITELTALQQQLSATERHNAIGQMAASLAHDFNNVLDTIEKATTVLEMKADAPKEQRLNYMQMIHNAVLRGAEIVHRLRQYLRDRSTDVGPVDLRKVIEETVDLTRPLLDGAQVKVYTELGSVPQVSGNVTDLRRVFTNLIMNAVEAMPRGGDLRISLEEHNSGVRARVQDTGTGIPREQQKKIFYPYFSTKQSGTGLGLSSAQRIVLSYGGDIRVQSEPGKGTLFTIELPGIASRNAGNGNGKVRAIDGKKVA